MPTSKTEFAESFVWQGPLQFWQGITIGIMAIAVTACLMWFEGRRTNTRLPWLFLLLRTVVVSLVLWMLLGPAAQTLRRDITPKSIAIISDVSSSMQTVDPPRANEDLRGRFLPVPARASRLYPPTELHLPPSQPASDSTRHLHCSTRAVNRRSCSHSSPTHSLRSLEFSCILRMSLLLLATIRV